MFFKNFSKFSDIYRVSIFRRIVFGFILGLITGTLFLAFSFLLQLILPETNFFQSFIHDIPSIGLIISFIIFLEIIGLIPHPTTSVDEEKDILDDKIEDQPEITKSSSEKEF